MQSDQLKENTIIRREDLGTSIVLFELFTPEIARKVKAGQFVVIRVDDYAERIPLTVADHDTVKGSITIIVQVVGVSTRKMETLQEGDVILDVVGPLGKPSHIEKMGTTHSMAMITDQNCFGFRRSLL